MPLTAFLKKYYLPQRQSELTSMLNKLRIYNNIQAALNEFIQATKTKNKIEIIAQFVLTIREFIIIFKKSLNRIKPGDEKSNVESKMVELGIYLIRETYERAMLDKAEYFDLLKETARKVYSKHSWDFAIIECLINTESLQPFAIEKTQKKLNKAIKPSKPIRFEWKCNIHLDFFIDDLSKIFKLVKPRKQIYLLFDMTKTDFKIELSSNRLLHFLTLFYELHEHGAIKLVGNRGLFIYLQQHLQPPANEKYPLRDFRKLRHEAGSDIKSKTEITKVINPLLIKYCSNGQ